MHQDGHLAHVLTEPGGAVADALLHGGAVGVVGVRLAAEFFDAR